MNDADQVQDRVARIDTQLPDSIRSPADNDDPQSVIHVPSEFKDFKTGRPSTASPTDRSEDTVVSPSTPEPIESPFAADKVRQLSQVHFGSVLTHMSGAVLTECQHRRSSAHGTKDTSSADERRGRR